MQREDWTLVVVLTLLVAAIVVLLAISGDA